MKGAAVQVIDSSRTSIDTIFQYLKVMTPYKSSINHSDFEFGTLINAINNLEKNDNVLLNILIKDEIIINIDKSHIYIWKVICIATLDFE